MYQGIKRWKLAISPLVVFGLMLMFLAGCEEDPDKIRISNKKADAQGIVYFDMDGDGSYSQGLGDMPLDGVAVTMTDTEGTSQAVETDADGFYALESLVGGAYTMSFEKDGYRTVSEGTVVDLGDTNGDGFVAIADVSLLETTLTATVSWLSNSGVDLENQGLLGLGIAENGVQGVSALYTQATDTDITVTFSSPVLSRNTGGSDISPSGSLDATLTSFVFLEADINLTANVAGPGSTALSNNVIFISASRVTPIHGVVEDYFAELDLLVK